MLQALRRQGHSDSFGSLLDLPRLRRRPAPPACSTDNCSTSDVKCSRSGRSASGRTPGCAGYWGAALSRRAVFAAALRVGQWAAAAPAAGRRRLAFPRACARKDAAAGTSRARHGHAAGLRPAWRLRRTSMPRPRACLTAWGCPLTPVKGGGLLWCVEPSFWENRARPAAGAPAMFDAWTKFLDDGAEAIVSSASGCGVM